MRTAIAALTLGVVVLLGASVQAQVSPGQPQLFTIEGIVAPDQPTANKIGYDPLEIGFLNGNATKWLGVVAARSLDGDSFQGKEMIESLLPKSPNVLVDGPKDLVAQLQNAPNGARIVVEGMLIPTSRNWMISMVKTLPPGAKAPAGMN
jgi:hypothetical protein